MNLTENYDDAVENKNKNTKIFGEYHSLIKKTRFQKNVKGYD